ncbi:protein translocase subunit SecD [Streptomyces oceani]|uniref:Protein translocase subunit SecD n=1 Tax=Streptomyces oceani TaxID=1075402 RepID=A0A1E7JYD0_9ACTN|nr:protein translocase subunit SecD [Streptomyces oceani]OEU96698.1 preprotein translocase subunit SecD [Streptomyces oceani]
MAAPKKGRRSKGGYGKPGRALLALLALMVALTGGMFLSGETTPRLGIDLAGGTSITLTAKEQPGGEDAINPTNMSTAVSIIDSRVNGLGVSEAEVQTQGEENIVVNIPKGTNEKQAREQVGTTAKLKFRPVLTIAQSQPPEKPSPSPSKSGDSKDEKQDQDNKQDQGDASEATPSAGADSQGRAVTDGLTDKDDPEGSQKTPKQPSQPPMPNPNAPPPGAGIPKDLQKDFAKLDCSTPKARSEAAREAAQTKASEPVLTCDQEQPVKYALGPVAVQGKNVDEASAALDQQQGGWIVQMSFGDKGSKQFADITGELAQKQQPQNQFAIVLDGEVMSAPSVSERLAGDAQISGDFKQEEAEDLANILSYGALPLTFEESNVTTISPSLGSDQLDAGLIAGGIGLALVVLYLVFYYRLLGLVAVASLGVAAVLTYTIMTLLGPTIGFALSLPAVCGAIVAIGITADSFIVYFERVRDELRGGRTVRPAIARAWPDARRTIVVSDVVSVIAAVVLFLVSVGSVQGFAFVLGLTTVVDVIIVFLLTKPLMTFLGGRKFFASGRPWSGLDPKRFGNPPLRRRRSTAATSEPKEA